MGKKLLKKAKELGYLKFRKTVLYAGAKKVRYAHQWYADLLDLVGLPMFDTYVPDTANEIRVYLMNLDPLTKFGISRPDRKKSLYYLSTELNVFVEVEAKVSGFAAIKGNNHVIKINIYCDREELVKGIASAVSDLFVGGIVNDKEMDWEKIEDKFKVSRDECISAWNAVL
ncbi:MAG: hypothetical protein ACFE96_13470 [Candidatus Hermodarchaeota archaeon]